MYKLGVKQHEKHVILLYKYLYFTVFFWLPTLRFYMYFYGVWYKVKKTAIQPIQLPLQFPFRVRYQCVCKCICVYHCVCRCMCDVPHLFYHVQASTRLALLWRVDGTVNHSGPRRLGHMVWHVVSLVQKLEGSTKVLIISRQPATLKPAESKKALNAAQALMQGEAIKMLSTFYLICLI